MANDSTVKAGSWGARTVEKIIRIIERAYAAGRADGLPGRLGRRPDHRPGRPVPRPARRRARSSTTRSAPPARSRRSARCSGRPRPAAPTSRRSATWSRWSTATPRMYLGSDRMVEMVTGEKTTLEAMGGAAVHTERVRRRALPLQDRGRGARDGPPLPVLPAVQLDRAAARRRGRPRAPTADLAALVPANERQAFDMRRFVKGLLDEGSFFEIQALLGARADGRLRPARRRGRRRRRQQLDVQGRRAVRRLRRQGDPVRPALRRVQRAAAVPLRRARLHGRHRGGEAGHHPARRQDDHRDLRGDRAEDLRRGAQGVRRRPLRDGRPGLRCPTRRSRCPPRRSR